MSLQLLKPKTPRIGSTWVIHCDGATRESNPSSEGGWGFAVFCDDLLYYAQHGHLVGHVTNQVAEFSAISKALLWCVRKGLDTPIIRSDSMVAISVQLGESNLRNERLQLLQASITHSQYFVTPTYEHVPRTHEFQRFADFLSNLGIHEEVSYRKLSQQQALLAAYAQW